MMQSVQVIIERLKSHPEDFFGDLDENKSLAIKQPKFYGIASKLDDLLRRNNDGIDRLWFLKPEERDALIAAYTEAHRARFEAKVFHTLLTKQEEPVNTVTMRTQGRYVGTGANSAVPHTLGWEPEMVLVNSGENTQWAKAHIKREGDPV